MSSNKHCSRPGHLNQIHLVSSKGHCWPVVTPQGGSLPGPGTLGLQPLGPDLSPWHGTASFLRGLQGPLLDVI